MMQFCARNYLSVSLQSALDSITVELPSQQTKQRKPKVQMKEELWNNSWVKNLLVRPLAPRRKTPGPAEPLKQRPPRAGSKRSLQKINLSQEWTSKTIFLEIPVYM